MRASRAKLVTFSAVAAGLVVLGAAAVVEKDRILERWYLYRLERADSWQDAEEVIAGLGQVGGEKAIVKLFDLWSPWGRLESESGRSVFAEVLNDRIVPSVFEEILDRIGENRYFAVVTKYIRDFAHGAKNRAYVAEAPFDSWLKLNQSREVTEAKEAALVTCSELLDSKDEIASRRAADFLGSLNESELDQLSSAAKETFKRGVQRAIERQRRRH